MSGRHQKRPDSKFAEPHLHSAPAEMAAAHNPVNTEGYQRTSDYDLDVTQRQNDLDQSGEKNHNADRHRMAQSNRRHRTDDRLCAFLLNAKSDGEEPTHTRVDAVISAEEKQRSPTPGCAMSHA